MNNNIKEWKELTRIQKILIGAFVISIVILVPESGFLLDVGGIDLLLFILFFYSQNIKLWFDLHFGFMKYPHIEVKTFITHTTLSSTLMLLTGSVGLAYGFFLVVMFLKGV